MMWLYWAHPANPGSSPCVNQQNSLCHVKQLLHRFWGLDEDIFEGSLSCIPEGLGYHISNRLPGAAGAMRIAFRGFPGGSAGKESACQCRRHKRCRFYRWVGKIPWRRARQPMLPMSAKILSPISAPRHPLLKATSTPLDLIFHKL